MLKNKKMILNISNKYIPVIMTTRKPCVNIATASFSGKEQSPLHFGLSAEGYELNTVMEGFDHMIWIVKIKNNRKVWVRQICSKKMVHEEPVINNNSDTESNDSNYQKETNNEIIPEISQNIQEHTTVITETPSPVIKQLHEVKQKSIPIMKATVEEKKINDYNLFLTYRLQELKKDKKGTNKEIFNSVVAEWKELKKNTNELNKIIAEIKTKQSS
jgi:hypothetical protein